MADTGPSPDRESSPCGQVARKSKKSPSPVADKTLVHSVRRWFGMRVFLCRWKPNHQMTTVLNRGGTK